MSHKIRSLITDNREEFFTSTMTTNEEQPQGPSTGCGILGRYPILSVVAFVSALVLAAFHLQTRTSLSLVLDPSFMFTGGLWSWIGCRPLGLGTG